MVDEGLYIYIYSIYDGKTNKQLIIIIKPLGGKANVGGVAIGATTLTTGWIAVNTVGGGIRTSTTESVSSLSDTSDKWRETLTTKLD